MSATQRLNSLDKRLRAHWPLFLALGMGLAAAGYEALSKRGLAGDISSETAAARSPAALPKKGPSPALDPHAGVVGAPPLSPGADPHAGVVGAPPLSPGADPHAGVVGAPPLSPGADPHAGVVGAPPLSPGANPHMGAAGALGSPANPHTGVSRPPASVAIGAVTKAQGPLGRTVSEIYAERADLRGKPVRVRGVVVKSTSGVLGRTFLHVQDGSGNASAGNHDLTVTTSSQAKLGSQVLMEGKLTTDKDFGAGYTYPILLEDARVLEPADAP